MNKKFGLASAFAAVLMVSSASAAFAAGTPTEYDNTQDQKIDKNTGDITQMNKGFTDITTKLGGKIASTNKMVKQHTLDILQNSMDIGANKSKIAKNTKSINEINSLNDVQSAAIDHNAKRLDENDSMNTLQNKNIDSNTKRLDQNDSENAIQNAAIDHNTKGVAQNKADIATTQSEIGDDGFRQESVQNHLAEMNTSINNTISQTSASDRAYTDTVAADTLNKANAYTDSRYNHLNGKINKLRSRVDQGVSGATAIGSLAFDSTKKNSIAGGFGIAQSQVAGAVGYQHNFNAHWRARGTVAVGGNYVQGGGSVGYSW